MDKELYDADSVTEEIITNIETLNEFQEEAIKLAIYPSIGHNIVYPTLGLVGEAGEFADKIKKVFRDNHGRLDYDTKKELIKELGDVLWYVAALAHELGCTLRFVGVKNLEKLASRHQRNTLQGNGDNR